MPSFGSVSVLVHLKGRQIGTGIYFRISLPLVAPLVCVCMVSDLTFMENLRNCICWQRAAKGEGLGLTVGEEEKSEKKPAATLLCGT